MFALVGATEVQLADGQAVAADSDIATRDGLARITVANATELRLDRFTSIRLVAPTQVVLTTGRIYVETRHAHSIEVISSIGRVMDLGTSFEIAVEDGRLTTTVRDGEVRLDTTTASESANVRDQVGGVLSTDGGSISVGERATYAPEWNWIDQVGPGYATQDTVDAMLTAIAKDLGVKLSYATPKAQSIATNAHVEGHFDRISPGVALELILASSDLIQKDTRPGVLLIDIK